MSDLRTRIAAVLWANETGQSFEDSDHRERSWENADVGRYRDYYLDHADAIIRELGSRRCERCRHHKPVNEFPNPYKGSRPRPFCANCTTYIEWATS